MKSLFLVLLFLGCMFIGCNSFGADLINVDKLADAIYKAENSVKYPYGIKSINTYGDKVLARKICINTIKNNIKRFNKQKEYTDYITFLGSRYCPPSAHKLNLNWVKNVKRFYNG